MVESIIAHLTNVQVLSEIIPFVFTVELGTKENGTATDAAAVGAPLEQLLTQQDIGRTLLLCGIKQHHCSNALKHLWECLLNLCREYLPGSTCEETAVRRSDSAPRRFATLVRQEDLRCVLQSLTGKSKEADSDEACQRGKRELLREMLVPPEEILSVVAELQGSTIQYLGGNQFPRPRHVYALIVDKQSFDKCITRLLTHELRGKHITVAPLPRWRAAQAVVQQRRALVVFCGGTSGCGKSTLSNLITTHLSIGTSLSTDTIRQALRRTLPCDGFPEVFTSTYAAHEASAVGNGSCPAPDPSLQGRASIDPQRVTAAYEKQCASVLAVLDLTLEKLISRNQAVVVEGVHLLPSYMHQKAAELRARGLLCVCFLVYIKKEELHLKRFCTRAQYMSLSPKRNKYVSNFHNIRLIQQHLIDQAERCDVKLINNTNLDQSLMVVHTCLLDSMDREDAGSAHHWNAISGKQARCEKEDQDAQPVGDNNNFKNTNQTARFAAHCKAPYPDISGKRMLALLLHRRNEKIRRANINSIFSGGGGCEQCTPSSPLTQSRRSRSAESLSTIQLNSLATFTRACIEREKCLLKPGAEEDPEGCDLGKHNCDIDAMTATSWRMDLDYCDGDDGFCAGVCASPSAAQLYGAKPSHMLQQCRSGALQEFTGHYDWAEAAAMASSGTAAKSPQALRSASANSDYLTVRRKRAPHRRRGRSAATEHNAFEDELGVFGSGHGLMSAWSDNCSSEAASLTCC
uniref:WGS project CAEQ00000000 data, annotated contig 372 n=1 Tax=Trypanosoma congolense (strain IL3000) TaxID=1068625 RepID=F9WFD3_TRYCI|nr:unnamed protein product [Trypanosoma congolense IL3000]